MSNESVIHHVGKAQINSEMLSFLEQLQDNEDEIEIRVNYLTTITDILILYEGPNRIMKMKEALLTVLALMKQDFEKLRKPCID